MDLQTLSNLFATTYSSDPNVQKSGELQIRKVRSKRSLTPSTVAEMGGNVQLGAQEGMIAALLQIIANDNVELYVYKVQFCVYSMLNV